MRYFLFILLLLPSCAAPPLDATELFLIERGITPGGSMYSADVDMQGYGIERVIRTQTQAINNRSILGVPSYRPAYRAPLGSFGNRSYY